MSFNFGRYIGDIFGASAENDRQFNSAEAQKSREFNSVEAQKVRDWETTMSNTAYQRQVADMQKAGINPILSAGGQGASTPTASPATSTPASVSSSPNGLISSAVKVGSLIAGVALKNPKLIAMGFGADISNSSKRNRYS